VTDLQIVIILGGLVATGVALIWHIATQPSRTPECSCPRDRHGIRMLPDPDCPLHRDKP
jgi:hypothetical protein